MVTPLYPTRDVDSSRGNDDVHEGRLVVHPEFGAGLEVRFVPNRGYVVEDVSAEPGQTSVHKGDIIIFVRGRDLALHSEEDADEVLSNELAHDVEHGVPVRLRRAPHTGDRLAGLITAAGLPPCEVAPPPGLHQAVDEVSGTKQLDIIEYAEPGHDSDEDDDGEIIAWRAPGVAEDSQDDFHPDAHRVPEPRFLVTSLVSPLPPSKESGHALAASASCSPNSTSVPAELSTEVSDCKVKELRSWLEEMSLSEYHDVAARWCNDMGAATLDELAENVEDFCEAVALKPIERQRLRKWAAKVADDTSWFAASSAIVPLRNTPALAMRDAMPMSRPLAITMEDCSLPAGIVHGHESNCDEEEVAIYTASSVRLAMDSSGATGLDLRWDAEWGISVLSVDPLPGQPGLQAGDFIVAIDGCSLRHRSHEECDELFATHLTNGAVLSVATPTRPDSSLGAPTRRWERGLSHRPPGTHPPKGKGKAVARHALPWQLAVQTDDRRPGKGRSRGGYDPNRMWSRFQNPW